MRFTRPSWRGRDDRVNPERVGTKAAAHYRATVGPGQSLVIRTRLADRNLTRSSAVSTQVFDLRRQEADAFYETVHRPGLSADERSSPASGAGRPALVEAVLSLQRRAVA